ncbi:unnamed protein product [Strongylus vulgaris]|uniref:Uncharacterized protein n=1 Tax=Strongylus vulgaris TaxID=40348 RepID=A0A3P7IFK7_STRVU|nr:unnamed protein product [Strongylus vulgaris]
MLLKISHGILLLSEPILLQVVIGALLCRQRRQRRNICGLNKAKKKSWFTQILEFRLSRSENGESDSAHNLNGDESEEKVEPLTRPDSVESDDVVCLEDHSKSAAAQNQGMLEQSDDPYGYEYFNYQDPYMEEAWYEPVEMSQLGVSQSVQDAEEEPVKNYRCSKSPTGERKVTSRRKSQLSSATEDSFFDTPKFVIPLTESLESKEMNENPITLDGSSPNFILPVAQSTPAEPARKKARFGSNVKVLKTSEITPMPNYEGMADEKLKVRK